MPSSLSSLFSKLQVTSPPVFVPLASHSSATAPATEEAETGSLISYQSFASPASLEYLSNPQSWSGSTSQQKLTFYQDLCVAFGVCDYNRAPKSIKQCRESLKSSVFISLKEFHDKVVKGGMAVSSIHRYDSQSDLRNALKSNRNLILKLGVAKKEMLQPLLIEVSNNRRRSSNNNNQIRIQATPHPSLSSEKRVELPMVAEEKKKRRRSNRKRRNQDSKEDTDEEA